jgi:hypothetical protein
MFLNMNKFLFEDYFNSTEQLNMQLKNYEKQQRKDDKAYPEKQALLISILGRNTYNKYANTGTFAPIPLSALHLTVNDFLKIYNSKTKKYDMELTLQLIGEIKKLYNRNDFNVVEISENTKVIQTNIVFKTLNDIIQFFLNIKTAVKKIYKSDDINWTALTKKFRNYLK